MIAFAWKILVWFGIGVTVALGVLIVPLHVAAERKRLDSTTSEIAQAQRDIRALETEFETRANIAQLERWNGETLRLSAPVAGQYLPDEAALAAVSFKGALGGRAGVQTAALIVPQHNAAPTAMPAATAAPAVVSVAVASAKPQSQEQVSTKSPSKSSASGTAVASGGNVAPAKSAAKPAKPQAMAMLDRKLLSDAMIGDLVTGASAEARRTGRLH